MGYEERKPSSDELACMKTLVSKSMDEGAFGLSTGLIYPPSCYAATDEIVELSSCSFKRRIYATHIEMKVPAL